jgi:hypothetical protein
MFARMSAFPQIGKSARLDILNAVFFVLIKIKKNFIHLCVSQILLMNPNKRIFDFAFTHCGAKLK